MADTLGMLSKWLVFGSLLLAAFNVLAELTAMSIAGLNILVVIAGFIAAFGLLYDIRGLEFKTLMDATLWFVLISALIFIATGGIGNLVGTIPLVTPLLAGIQPYTIGFVAGGIFAGIIALVRMGKA